MTEGRWLEKEFAVHMIAEVMSASYEYTEGPNEQVLNELHELLGLIGQACPGAIRDTLVGTLEEVALIYSAPPLPPDLRISLDELDDDSDVTQAPSLVATFEATDVFTELLLEAKAISRESLLAVAWHLLDARLSTIASDNNAVSYPSSWTEKYGPIRVGYITHELEISKYGAVTVRRDDLTYDDEHTPQQLSEFIYSSILSSTAGSQMLLGKRMNLFGGAISNLVEHYNDADREPGLPGIEAAPPRAQQ